MNSFFEYYFYEYDFSKRETAVCCPFPHHTESGIEYHETNPSAHINLDKGLFHCKVCDVGLSEISFISKVLGTSYEAASKIAKLFTTKEDRYTWNKDYNISEEIKNKCINLGISEKVIDELELKTEMGDEISFPVFMYGKLVDVRSYRPQDRANKIKSRVGATSGLIIPFDIWTKTPTNKWTIICAGEKDMAVTRSHGFNAITLTGGEKALPKMTTPFKDRKIAICYDNDEAGIAGARALASELIKYVKEVRVVTNFHEVCKEHGEDLTDFFTKYNKTKEDLMKYVLATPAYTIEEAKEEIQKRRPLISLLEASKPQYINRVVQSNIQVVATYETAMPVPTTIYAKKLNSNGDAKYNQMNVGEERTWELSENNCQDILKLIDNNFTEDQIRDNIRSILGISKYERDVRIEKPTKDTVYQCNVTDLFEATAKDIATIEFTAYVLKKRLESGKKYLITYKLVPHPYKGQKLIMIIIDVEEACDSITNFKITDEVKQELDLFKNLEGTVKERVHTLSEMAKAYIGYDGYNNLIEAIDLSFHTVLEFNFGTFKNIRGYLDTLIVAESRVGKSSTAEALQKLYNLGAFTSLAGNSATIPGIIGGSTKVNGSYQTRAGLIPMNHRGLVIFEELAKCNSNLVRELTDIRSSNQVRIARVSGTLTLPALVRMITLTNVKNTGHKIKPINSYPNGVDILVELIGSPEDIARYDLMLILGEQGNRTTNPFWEPIKPFEPKAYQTRIRWVWSRTADQVLIDKEVGTYIIQKCNELNTKYDSHIKIFGTEAWKKVARLSIAIAGYLVSTDTSYERIIVTKEHVDAAIDYLVSCYDNSTFKLKEYVAMERLYNEIDDDGIALLQDLYNSNASILLQLERLNRTNKQNIMAATGLETNDYNKFMQRLTQGLFVTYEGYDIIPTQRFRLGMSKINRAGNIHRVGEYDA
jgi:DNA primase